MAIVLDILDGTVEGFKTKTCLHFIITRQQKNL